jgi:hypothetical protein
MGALALNPASYVIASRDGFFEPASMLTKAKKDAILATVPVHEFGDLEAVFDEAPWIVFGLFDAE